MTAPDIRIGNKLRILREVRGMKQQEVADKLEISQNAYSRLEQNQTKLSLEQAEKLAEIFDVSLPDLISKDNPIISFTYRDSVTVENSPGYVNNKFEMSQEAFNAVINTKDEKINELKEAFGREVHSLKEEVEYLREQNKQLIALLKNDK